MNCHVEEQCFEIMTDEILKYADKKRKSASEWRM